MPSQKQKKDAPEQQIPLIEIQERWQQHWDGMPSWKQEDLMPYKSIVVHFAERKDMIAFGKLVNQEIDINTKSIWHPEKEIQAHDMEWVSDAPEPEPSLTIVEEVILEENGEADES